MPLITAAGQAEATASVQPIGRVEATAAYSPVPHLLLTTGGTVCPKLGTDNFLVTRQYELGAGSYLPLGSSWLLNGLGGYGQAVNTRRYQEFLGGYNEYYARYNKLFAQVGVARLTDGFHVGLTYRLTQVRFSTLIDTQLGEKLPLSRMLRHEALLFTRHSLGSRYWELLATMGLSVSSTAQLSETDPLFGSYISAASEANNNLRPVLYTSLGFVYHPDWGRATAGR